MKKEFLDLVNKIITEINTIFSIFNEHDDYLSKSENRLSDNSIKSNNDIEYDEEELYWEDQIIVWSQKTRRYIK